jgi:hypothetical protein
MIDDFCNYLLGVTNHWVPLASVLIGTKNGFVLDPVWTSRKGIPIIICLFVKSLPESIKLIESHRGGLALVAIVRALLVYPMSWSSRLGISKIRYFNLLVFQTPEKSLSYTKSSFHPPCSHPFCAVHSQSSEIPTHKLTPSAETIEWFLTSNSNDTFGWFDLIGTTRACT